MNWRLQAVAALLAGPPTLAACVPTPSLPTGAIPTVTCIYDTLKGNPRITSVEVEVTPGNVVPLIEYEYRNSKGKQVPNVLVVLLPKASDRYQYEGDFMSPDDPVSGMVPEL